MSNMTITETLLYLTFKLEDEIFAIDVSQVREVLDISTITKVPQTPDFMRGVINVRGSVVPVVDMRCKFGMPSVDNTTDTRIVVMEVTMDGETIILGAMADSVKEVIELKPGDIEPSPRLGTRWRTDLIKGIGKRNDLFLLLLDVDRLFSSDELAIVQASGDEPLAKQAVIAETTATAPAAV